jgi:hypothetical protein
MAYEHSYTGQIPPQIGNLGCLLVKNDGAPIGTPFVLPRIEDLFVSQLAERITARRSDIPSGVLSDLIYLWKTDPPLPYQSSSSELLRALNGLHLNEPGNERNVTRWQIPSHLANFSLQASYSLAQSTSSPSSHWTGRKKKVVIFVFVLY